MFNLLFKSYCPRMYVPLATGSGCMLQPIGIRMSDCTVIIIIRMYIAVTILNWFKKQTKLKEQQKLNKIRLDMHIMHLLL